MVSATGFDDKDWDDTEELALIEADDRLPWLESGEEDNLASGGVDTGRVMMMGLLALLVLLAVVAAIWFVSNRAGSEPAPDGSVIAAPEGPYKVRPEDEGGKTFAGTGDTSFAVGEGETRDARLATGPAARPSVASTLSPDGGAESQPAQTGVGVQVGAYSRREDAEAGWATLIRQTEALSGVNHRIVEGQADIGRVFRLQAVAGSRDAANRLCAALKADGLACQVK